MSVAQLSFCRTVNPSFALTAEGSARFSMAKQSKSVPMKRRKAAAGVQMMGSPHTLKLVFPITAPQFEVV